MAPQGYAEIIVNITGGGLDRPFSYRVPEEMAGEIAVGSCVLVPFGQGGRTVEGYVTALTGKPDLPEERIREIAGIRTDPDPALRDLVLLADWMARRYSCTMIQALRTVLPRRRKVRTRASSPASAEHEPGTPEKPVLTDAQAEALRLIRGEFAGTGRPVLLYGKTGSGKTLLYMELAADALSRGRSVIILIPEIALTYQTVMRFRARFGDTVGFLHSRLSEGEKYALHRDCLSGKVRIAVGPRSALFSPFPDPGLIVIDEEQDEAYLSESTPRYDARETAAFRASQCGANLLLGSATPSVRSFYLAERGQLGLVRLTEKYGAGSAETILVDMREEMARGNRSILSEALRESLAGVLENGRQAMLFLNRRGVAGFVTCRSCGYTAMCPHCAVSLTEHRGGRLVCHYCGYTSPMPAVCPSCGSEAFSGLRIGTQSVERALRSEFPDARILRMDKDTTGGKEGHEKILRAFRDREADILLGTQMIIKGHDYPAVQLMGVLSADLSLNDGDYRSAERTFSMLSQAIGRAGRAGEAGSAVIQTYHPEHYAVQRALTQDADGFYREEIAFRNMMEYPPACSLCAVLLTGKDEEALRDAADHVRGFLKKIDPGDRLHALGPVPDRVSRIRDVYRMLIYLRSGNGEHLRTAAGRIRKYAAANRGFDRITIQFDYNM